jgi:hypothetical protein
MQDNNLPDQEIEALPTPVQRDFNFASLNSSL